jgi:hypothetical protein
MVTFVIIIVKGLEVNERMICEIRGERDGGS